MRAQSLDCKTAGGKIAARFRSIASRARKYPGRLHNNRGASLKVVLKEMSGNAEENDG